MANYPAQLAVANSTAQVARNSTASQAAVRADTVMPPSAATPSAMTSSLMRPSYASSEWNSASSVSTDGQKTQWASRRDATSNNQWRAMIPMHVNPESQPNVGDNNTHDDAIPQMPHHTANGIQYHTMDAAAAAATVQKRRKTPNQWHRTWEDEVGPDPTLLSSPGFEVPMPLADSYSMSGIPLYYSGVGAEGVSSLPNPMCQMWRDDV